MSGLDVVVALLVAGLVVGTIWVLAVHVATDGKRHEDLVWLEELIIRLERLEAKKQLDTRNEPFGVSRLTADRWQSTDPPDVDALVDVLADRFVDLYRRSGGKN